MTKNNKIILGAVIVLAVGIMVWALLPKKYDPSYGTPGTAPSAEDKTSVSTSTTTAPKLTPKKPAAVKPLGYGELVKKYEGYRFQFSVNCSQVTPSSFVLKKGEKFMIDNRDDKKHTFGFGGQKFSVGAFGYVIVTAQLAGDQYVLCDGVQRARVNVQK